MGPERGRRGLVLGRFGHDGLCGGQFISIGGTTRNRLAAIGTDGTLAAWDPNADSTVRALAVSGATVYAGGQFTTLGGTTRNRLAAIATDGTLAAWDPNAGGQVNALAVADGGSPVYAGGLFTTIGGSACGYFGQFGSSSTSTPTTTALASSVNPSTFGASVTFTATVSPSAATGTVTFKDGATTLGTGTLSGGTATYSTSGLTTGDHSITAEYGGDGSYAASTSSALTQTVNPAGPATRTPVQSGPWNDPATWGGTLPEAGEDVVIPVGIAVTVGADPLAIRNLTIAGTLTVSGTQTLQISGNYTNTGTFTPGTGTVVLTGGDDQILAATAPGTLTFYKLTVNKDVQTATVTATSKLKVTRKATVTKGKLISASDYQDILIETDGTLELTSDITITGDLVVQGNGTLTTAGHKVTFDGGTNQNLTSEFLVQFDDLTVSAGTTLIETESANNVVVNGTVLNQGVIRKTQVLDASEWYYFGLAGNYASADMEIHVTDRTGATPLTAIQVDRKDANHPQAPGTNTTSIYWTITPTGSDFVASLALPQDGLPDPQVCRYRNSVWDWARSAFDPNTVTRTGLTAFGDFAVFDTPNPLLIPPTAVDDTVTRSPQGLTKIAVAQLLANDSDPLGRTITLSSVSTGTGGSVSLSGRWITFTPEVGLPDGTPATFTYVLSNGTASTAVATVTLNAPGATYTTTNATLLHDGIVNNPGGPGKLLTFAAIPNFIYQVEASSDLSDWVPLGSFTAGPDGRLVVTDTGATEAARFYRFKK